MKKFIFVILLGIASPAFSQLFPAGATGTNQAMQVTVVNFDDIMIRISKLFYDFFKAADSWFVQKTMPPKEQIDKETKVSDNLKISLDQYINLDMSDDSTKEKNDRNLAELYAGDDNPTLSNLTDAERQRFVNTTITSIYASSGDTAKKAEATNQSNNALFNSAMYIEPLKYKTSGKPSDQELATKYLRYLINLAPSPTVITLGPVFDVPWSSKPTESKTTINLAEVNKKIADMNRQDNKNRVIWNTTNLKNELLNSSDYKDYRLNYRTVVATRSLFLNNLLRAYQKRLVANGDKSLAQMEYDQVYKYFGKDYMDRINGVNEKTAASPVEIQRESLFLLAEINRQLYEMRQDQERLLIAQSISGLQALAINKAAAQMTNRKIAQKIYCTVMSDLDAENCGSASKTPGGSLVKQLPGGEEGGAQQ